MEFNAFLLALQASGMVVDWLGRNEQVRLGKMGEQVEQAGINANMATSRLEAEDASLQSMKKLRMNLGTQAAMLAARGVRAGAGSAIFSAQNSISNFNADERTRRINLLGNQAALKAGKTLSTLHEKTFENNTWNEFRNNSFKKLPTSPEAWDKIASGFSAKNNYGFGLSKVTG